MLRFGPGQAASPRFPDILMLAEGFPHHATAAFATIH
jgi:hypothetical protein